MENSNGAQNCIYMLLRGADIKGTDKDPMAVLGTSMEWKLVKGKTYNKNMVYVKDKPSLEKKDSLWNFVGIW